MPYEIDFLRAGDSNGDAIVVKWGDTKDGNFYLNVIDGGFTDTGDQIIEHIKRYYAKNAVIANVVLTHADNDSWLLRRPTLAFARLLKALPLLPVKLLVKSYRVAD